MRSRIPASGLRCLLWALAFAVSGAGGAEKAEPFTRGLLFRVDAPGKPPSWVFGTVHSNDPRVTALPDAVSDALAKSRRLAPEIFLSVGDLPDFFASAQFDDGRRLADYFDPATLAAIRAALGVRAPPPQAFDHLKPWAILLLLAQSPDAGAAPTLDEVLIDDARRRRMTVIGLELPEEQIASLDTVPVASQVALARWALARRGDLAAENEAAITAWLAGDLAGLAALAAAPGRGDPALAAHLAQLTRHLVVNRSVLMAHRLFLPLREGRIFVAVGALHLYGRDGLLALIRAQGYRVRRVFRRRVQAAGEGRAKE